MTTVFDRAYLLQIGPILVDGSAGANGALRCAFSVERDTSTDPNSAEFVVYNLTASNRKELAATENVYVRFSAGYVGDLNLIFDGWLRRVEVIKDGAEWLTRVSAGDGEGKIVSSRAHLTFRKGALVRDVLAQLVTAMGGDGAAVAPNLPIALMSRTIPHGFAIAGNARQCLGQACANLGLEWSAQNGSIVVLEKGRARNTLDVPLISPDTGLLGSPRHDKPNTVICSTVLLPGLQPGDAFRLESRSMTGDFRVEKSVHHGDTHEGDAWGIEIEGKKL